MTSLKTARQLLDKGIDPDLSLEELIHKVENLGYNGICQSQSPKGYKFIVKFKGNTYICRKIMANSLKEAYASVLLLRDCLE